MPPGTDDGRVVIGIDTVLRNLDKALRGIDEFRDKLQRLAKVKPPTFAFDASTLRKAAEASSNAAAKAQELANRQERARQASERLAVSAKNLEQAQIRQAQASQKAAQASQKQADSHVVAFKAIDAQAKKTAAEVARINAETAKQAAQQQRIQEQAARSITASQQFVAKEGANTLIASLDKSKDSADELAGGLNRVGGVLRGLGQGIASVGATLSVAITAPLVALGVLSVRSAVSLDSLKKGLTSIAGSSQEAAAQLQRLTEVAKLPGIGFQEAIQGSIRLQAVGISAQVAERALKDFANAVALTGGGRAELERITVQLGQLSAKGKVLSQDLRPIIEAAPAVGRAIREAFGTVDSEQIQKLGLSTEQFLDQLLTALEKLPKANAGARNSLENFTDALSRASAELGDAILPILTKTIDVIEPIITGLATGFSHLPPIVKSLIVTFGALAAAVGPTVFIIGLVVSGVGSLLGAFSRLVVLGLTPTIRGFQLLSAVMKGTASLTAGQAATTAAAAGGWALLGGVVVAAVAAIAAALLIYNASQKDAVKVDADRIQQQESEIQALKEQEHFLSKLVPNVKQTSEEQDKLNDIYKQLNISAAARIEGITDEEKRLLALREQLSEVIKLRSDERTQQAAALAGSLADTLATIDANENEIQSITKRVQANAQLSETLQREGKISAENSRILAQQGINFGEVNQAVGALQAESENLVTTQRELRDKTTELNGTAKEQADTLKVLEAQTGLTARQILLAAKNMGVFRGDIELTLKQLEKYTQVTKEAAEATKTLNDAINDQSSDLIKAGKAADEQQKQRKSLISSAGDLAREASNSFEGALKFFKAFIAAQPELRAAIEKEAKLSGKSIEEFVADALGGDKEGKAAADLANAREQLARTLSTISLAQAEKQESIQKQSNDRLLRENENAFKLNLRAYTLYLTQKAILTKDNLQLEIDSQQRIVDEASRRQASLLAQSKAAGLKTPDRIKLQAQVKSEEERSIKAQTKILELKDQQKQAEEDVTQALAEHGREQEKQIRELSKDFAEISGRLEDSLDATTIAKFRDTLQQLSLDQETLNLRIAAATKNRNAEELEALKIAAQRNQDQIDLINNIDLQEQSTNKLAVAQKFVEQSQEKQSDLEKQIAFDVDFRGLKEEGAIAKRLEGENKLAERLRISRDIVQDQINLLSAKGVPVPQALLDFVKQVNQSVKGLGELAFSEQFRLAEKEFNRINDERLQKIQEVERAVRNRTIAEVEGQILVRKVNGLYTADLEQQLELLRRIAEQSGQPELKKQANDAAETVRDTKDEIGSLTQQIESAGKDAFRSGLSDFFSDILNRTKSAKEAALDFLDSIVRKINDVIADNLAKSLFESIFKPDGNIFSKIKSFLGLGDKGEGAAGVIGQAAGTAPQTAAATAVAAQLTTGATVAAGSLATGAATAAASLVAGATTVTTALIAAGTTFSTGVIAAGTAFAAAVASAAAAFAAAVTASAAASAGASGLGSLGGSSGGGFASGGLVPIQLSAGEGYIPPENVRSMGIGFWNKLNERRMSLRDAISVIRGPGGPTSDSISALAPEGSFILRANAMQHYASIFLDKVSRRRKFATGGVVSQMSDADSGGFGSRSVDLKQVLVDSRSNKLRDMLSTSEDRDFLIDFITEERSEIRRRLRVRD